MLRRIVLKYLRLPLPVQPPAESNRFPGMDGLPVIVIHYETVKRSKPFQRWLSKNIEIQVSVDSEE
ncbi:MAG: hypothetical protein DSY57_04405 [Desulfobulbus sp.]|nr:MAG: hypothetical protein DSY57_04405 [Desulfobulbus sp.]